MIISFLSKPGRIQLIPTHLVNGDDCSNKYGYTAKLCNRKHTMYHDQYLLREFNPFLADVANK
jgi:hypothetical protein